MTPQQAHGSLATRLKCPVSAVGRFFCLGFLLWVGFFSKRCDCRDSFPVRRRDIGERSNGFFCGFNGTLRTRRVRFIQPFSVEVGRTSKEGVTADECPGKEGRADKTTSAKSFLRVLAGNFIMGKPVFSTPKLFHEPELGRALADRATCHNGLSRCESNSCKGEDRIGHQPAPSRQ